PLLPRIPVRAVGGQDAAGRAGRRHRRDGGRGMSRLAGAGPLWLVGCGNMGGAMLRAWRSAGLANGDILVIDPAAAAIEGVRVVTTPPPGEQPAVLVLGIKPQSLDAVVS